MTAAGVALVLAGALGLVLIVAAAGWQLVLLAALASLIVVCTAGGRDR